MFIEVIADGLEHIVKYLEVVVFRIVLYRAQVACVGLIEKL